VSGAREAFARDEKTEVDVHMLQLLAVLKQVVERGVFEKVRVGEIDLTEIGARVDKVHE
jgi:hypothetical protein